MSNRMLLVNSTMRKEISVIFRDFVNSNFTSSLITITHINTSNDLQNCHIYISILGQDSQKILRYLKSNTNKFHQILRKRLAMKFIPKLHWINDNTPKKAAHLNKLIDKLDQTKNE